MMITRDLQDSMRVCDSIARCFEIYHPIRTLYIDNSSISSNKVRTSLCLVPDTQYVIETVTSPTHAAELVSKGTTTFDLVLFHEVFCRVVNMIQTVPTIIVPRSILNYNRWKLGYTLHDMITEVLYHTHATNPSTEIGNLHATA